MVLELFYTNTEDFLEENNFTTFIYEMFYSTSNYHEGSVILTYYKRRSMTTMKTQNKIVSKQFDGYFYNYLRTHFHLYFFGNFTLTQFSLTVYFWGEQENCSDGTIVFYNFFSSHYSPNGYMQLEKGKECKETHRFGKKDRLLENKNLPSFSLNLLLCETEEKKVNAFFSLNVCHEGSIFLDRLLIQGVKRGLVSKERLVWKEDGQIIEFLFPYSSLNLYSSLFLNYNTALNGVKIKLWK